MTYWFSLVAHEEWKGGAGHLAALPGAELLYAQVEERVDQAFAGEAWLRRRFAGNRTVELRAALHEGMAVEVADVTAVGGSRKRVVGDLRLPADWFRGRADGVLGFRLMAAAVRGLHQVGADLGLGVCPLRSPGKGVRRGTDFGLFAPAEPAQVALVGRRVLAGAGRDTLIVVAGSELPEDRSWQREVVRKLGGTARIRDGVEEVSVWTAPRPT